MEASNTQSRRWVLSSIEETLDAAIDMVDMTHRRVSIYTPALAPGVYHAQRLLETPKRLFEQHGLIVNIGGE